ncbi:uncharacterized protein [Macrobrachium rosenbergii]|uniref:uncharacterized protein isoform X3 n=1 Tax=Macrobrachium rosenbergii TaxID=79674 RepID=UPI0034D79EBF
MMSATRWPLQWGQLLSLLLSVLPFVIAEDCIIPKSFPHFMTVDMQEVNAGLCYKCYGAPTKQQFQVLLHKLRLGGLGSMMMYVDGNPREFNKDCGECETENFIEVGKDGELNTKAEAQCRECDSVPSGSLLELYVRMNPQAQVPLEGENLCQSLQNILPNFNVSLNVIDKKPDAEASSGCDGGFSVNFPLSGDTCIVNSTTSTGETQCVVPTCSDGIISPGMSVEKVEHKFLPSSTPETCVWQLETEQRKHLTLKFSENIRPHLTIFEDSLLNPKWDIEWCPSFPNEFMFETEADKIFIVYRNLQKLTKKGTFSLSSQTDLCLLPPKLENGNVEFKHLDSGTVAYYSCDKGYILVGPKELRCKSQPWDKPPICLPVGEDKLMSDAPMGSIENLESVNASVLISENGTSLAPDSDAQGNMPETESYDMEEEGHENEEATEEYEEEKEIKKLAEQPTLVEEETYSNESLLEKGEGDESSNVNVHATNDSSSRDVLIVTDDTNRSLDILREIFNLTLEDDMTLYLLIGAAGLLVQGALCDDFSSMYQLSIFFLRLTWF